MAPSVSHPQLLGFGGQLVGQACELDERQSSLEAYFLENPPRSAREAQAAIERLTGVRRGLSQVRAFLKKKSA